LAFSVTVPCAGPVSSSAVSVSPSGSVSLASTPRVGTTRVVSSAVVYVSFAATGASLTLLTAIVTVTVLLVAVPSLAR
jgi:hypothetical protein